MINTPQINGMPQAQYLPNGNRSSFVPSYNAVQINLDTPTLNAPQAMPYYPPMNCNYQAYPQYQQSQVAQAQPQTYQQPAAQPVVQPQQQTVYQPVSQPVVPAPVIPAAIAPVTQPQQQVAVQQPVAQPQVNVVPPNVENADTMADKAFKGLCSNDYDEQALAMEDIAKKGLQYQDDVIPYLQENILDKLVDIISTDTSKLAGPTDRQIELRNKVAENELSHAEQVKEGKTEANIKLPHTLSQSEIDEANVLSPFEQAERNKEYAMFTTAILQKTYADEIAKQTGNVPPLTELPGSRAIISTLKSSDNPDMAVSAIDALIYVQRPEYKDDLTTLYTIAQTDSREEVANAAKAALEGLNAK